MADIFNQLFSKYNKAVVALSGGADSAAVLMLAAEYMGAENVAGATCINSHVFASEIDNAEKICKKLGVDHIKFTVESPPEFFRNDDDKCYYCKKAVMGGILALEGFDVIFDGTNADDDESDRPGSRAVSELGIVSPLQIAALGKSYTLEKVKTLGVKFRDESCKATRLTYEIDQKRMDRVEAFEQPLKDKMPGIRYRIDEGYVYFKKPLILNEKDFELINEAKHTIR